MTCIVIAIITTAMSLPVIISAIQSLRFLYSYHQRIVLLCLRKLEGCSGAFQEKGKQHMLCTVTHRNM